MKLRDIYNAYQYIIACYIVGDIREAQATLEWLQRGGK